MIWVLEDRYESLLVIDTKKVPVAVRLRIHTTKTLPIDFLHKTTAHLTPFSRLFEDWDHTSSTNMKEPYDEGYFFEIQSLEEMHALNAYLPISKCF